MNKPLVVITGASSGIGASAARAFSEAGHPLLLLARRLDKMEALALPHTLCRAVDVCDRSAFEAALDEAESTYGPVDALINNAGVMLLGHTETQNPEEWKRMFDVNVLALMNSTQIALQRMKPRRTGTIINVSSVAGRFLYPLHDVYCGTKHAVHAMTEIARSAHAEDNIRVCLVAPGVVETELLDHVTDQTIHEEYVAWKKSIGGGLDSQAVAKTLLFMYQQPQEVCLREIVLAPTRQPK